ncbi:hypothetical protein K7X08_037223 [Anisodus acutangulus]|uniref:Uncharacterized protein n=1 Tax=Anisodus acutangulus TaxID=402998 RepID=A0A9Q1MJD5_9SOLA|nr:hypothetical protein K7X08_037223 [Anisodus acutangulus]
MIGAIVLTMHRTTKSSCSTNDTSYDDMVFIPVVSTEERVTPMNPPPAAPTMDVLSPLPSSFPAPIEIIHAISAMVSGASSIAGDLITIPVIAVEDGRGDGIWDGGLVVSL